LYQKLSGYTDTELIGTYSLNNIYPDDREMVREKAIKCLKGKALKLTNTGSSRRTMR